MHHTDQRHRQLFDVFLERFANCEVDPGQWQRLIVNHYVDETLERVRRDCVRIRMQNESMRWTQEEKAQIEAWRRELTSSV